MNNGQPVQSRAELYTHQNTMDQISGSSAAAGPGAIAVPMQNRTADAKSPFVSGHRDSPVHWQLLDEEAIERARTENKLIFMHIGYKACHHCRLMDIESFSNPDCVSVLNESFIPIIIDRDERPELDTTYMNYVQAVSSSGGWPLNLFLTQSLEPVFGGTYWPGPGTSLSRQVPTDNGEEVMDFGMVLQKMKDTWENQEARCRREASEVITQLKTFAAEGVFGTRDASEPTDTTQTHGHDAPVSAPTTTEEKNLDGSDRISDLITPPGRNKLRGQTVSTELDLELVEEAYRRMPAAFDPVHGGFGLAPKFLTPPKLSFLLQLSKFPSIVQSIVGEDECKHAQNMALQTLRAVRDGSLRDHVGGSGFFRCSVTPDWSLPNFEKLVVDNGLLLSLYLEAWKATGGKEDGEFLDVVLELGNYLTTSRAYLTEGAFASSEAADSFVRRGDRDMGEGAYYLWTSREFDSATGSANNHISQVAAAYWDVRRDGNVDQDHDPNDNFMNQNILRVVKTTEELATQFSIPVSTTREYIQTARKGLESAREKDRILPELDDKVVTGWNGLIISALARAAIDLKELRPIESSRYLEAAKSAVRFIKANLWDESDKELYRIWKDGRSTKGFADDYAYFTAGLLDLYEATHDEAYLQFAEQLTETQERLFYDDQEGAFFTTTASSPHNILRLKDGMDASLPSTNAVSLSNLWRLHELVPKESSRSEGYFARAIETINAFEPEMLQHPWLFPGLLVGLVKAKLR